MTPNTRKRKSRLAEELTDFVEEWNLGDKENILDVVLLSLKQLGLSEELEGKLNTKTMETRGRKMTPFATRKVMWNFFHEEATPSTITSRPAKLKVSERSKIQTGLDFAGTTTIINQRGKQFYENNWMMLHTTYHELYVKFLENYPNHKVSLLLQVQKNRSWIFLLLTMHPFLNSCILIVRIRKRHTFLGLVHQTKANSARR